MNQKGNAIVSLLITIVIIAGLYLLWVVYQKLSISDASTPSLIPTLSTSTPDPNEFKDWKQFENSSHEVFLLYPPDWLSSGEDYIAQYPYKPGATGSVYNAITLRVINDQLHDGYNNDTWFNLMYNSKINTIFRNEYYSQSDQKKITKVSSGKVKTGERFIIVKNDANTDLTAYIMHDFLSKKISLYEMNLSSYDDPGSQLFQKILSTVSIVPIESN